MANELRYVYQNPGASLDPRWNIRRSLHEPLIVHTGVGATAPPRDRTFHPRPVERVLCYGSSTSAAATPTIMEPRRIVRRSSNSYRYSFVASFSSIGFACERAGASA